MSASLYDDNPALEDLLGFDAVAGVVARIVSSGGLDPVTVGIHSAWGGGKSTALNLIDKELSKHGNILVVRIDPWEFQNAEDMRGTLIAQVLDCLQTYVNGQKSLKDKAAELGGKLNDLRKRIAWGRVAKALVSSAVSVSLDLNGLVDALTPKEKTSDADEVMQGMAGFRQQFEQLMKAIDGLTRVVVLVDDLDRCLPPTIMATMESIKLFLSVKKMAFVIAADQDLIKDGVELELRGSARGGFAKLYTEKIVQIPVTLPQLSLEQAEAYIALLLCNSGSITGKRYKEIIAASGVRRRAGKAPYVVVDESKSEPTVEQLSLARSIASGLAADVWSSPRAIKRFLNAMAVREHLATLAGAELRLDVLVKLYLLELRYSEAFQTLAGKGKAERKLLVGAWEDWAQGKKGATAPEGVGDTKAWAAHAPSLRDQADAVDRYLSVASTLKSDVRFGGAVSAVQLELIELLCDPSESTRKAAVQRVLGLPAADQDTVVQGLCDALSRTDDAGFIINSLQLIIEGEQRHAQAAAQALTAPAVLRAIQTHHVVFLAKLRDVLTALAETPGIDERVARAASEELLEGRF
ncbi:hypothetical protein Cs7R123_79510 [Catellatospora sp. TT07R-123]|uniref:KAP family P-loop NTPase fold protein n=1 Tax=Catellatospora sp. TT07R-123 TaxID=2733863 RepID=UPI001B14E041|nr:P-loop NTPase fold protein [Catellatospora sp. TT07R-123]GHJ50609.1 hypothetical protein Cs7R123_79510 [Catellatospora sp. TT07R-123]